MLSILLLFVLLASASLMGIISPSFTEQDTKEKSAVYSLANKVTIVTIGGAISLCGLFFLRRLDIVPLLFTRSMMILFVLMTGLFQLNAVRRQEVPEGLLFRIILGCSTFWLILWIVYFEFLDLYFIKDLGEYPVYLLNILVYPAVVVFTLLLLLNSRLTMKHAHHWLGITTGIFLLVGAGAACLWGAMKIGPFLNTVIQSIRNGRSQYSTMLATGSFSNRDDLTHISGFRMPPPALISATSVSVGPGEKKTISLPAGEEAGTRDLLVTAFGQGSPQILNRVTVAVKTSLKVNTVWPGRVSPGDSLWLPVKINNVSKESRIVRVGLEAGGHGTLPGYSNLNIGLSPGEMVRCFFPFTIERSGDVKLTMKVGGDETERVYVWDDYSRQLLPVVGQGFVGENRIQVAARIGKKRIPIQTIVLYESLGEIAQEVWTHIKSGPVLEFSTLESRLRLALKVVHLANAAESERVELPLELSTSCSSELPGLYRALLLFRNSDGSFCQTPGLPGDLLVTARAVELLSLLKTLVPVDNKVRTGAELWLLGRQQENGSWRLKGEELMTGAWLEFSDARLACTAAVLRRLVSAKSDGRATRRGELYLRERWNTVLEDPYTLSMSILALGRQPFRKSELQNLLRSLKENLRRLGEDVYFESRIAPHGLSPEEESNLEVAALVLKSLAGLKVETEWKKDALRYLLRRILSGPARYSSRVLIDVVEILLDNAAEIGPVAAPEDLEIRVGDRNLNPEHASRFNLSKLLSPEESGAVLEIYDSSGRLILGRSEAIEQTIEPETYNPVSIDFNYAPMRLGEKRKLYIELETPPGFGRVGFCRIFVPGNLTVTAPGVKVNSSYRVVRRTDGELILFLEKLS
ncbi:MAG: hypothetical protein QGH40_06720, partial [bacterium]|nr:hypothetical protein [bacterium]